MDSISQDAAGTPATKDDMRPEWRTPTAERLDVASETLGALLTTTTDGAFFFS